MRVFSNLFLYTASNVFVLSFQLVFQFVVLKELNEIEYGIYSSAQLFSSYILLLGLGLQTNLAVKISRSSNFKMKDEEVNATFTYFVIIFLFGSISFLFFEIFNRKDFNKDFLFLLSLISIKGLFVQKFFSVILRTSKQIKILSYTQILVTIISCLFLLFFRKLGLTFIIYLLTVECFISLILYSKFIDINLAFNFTSLKDVLRDGFKFWRVNLLFSVFPVAVSSIAFKAFTLEDFGKFSVFYVTISMFTKLTASVDKLNYIEISSGYPDLSNVRPSNIFRKNILVVAFICLCILVLFLFFGEKILFMLLPNRISLYQIIIMGILASIVGLLNFLNVYFDVTEKLMLKYINIGFKFTIMILFLVILYYFGKLTIISMCIAVIISELTASVVNLYILKMFIPYIFHPLNEK